MDAHNLPQHADSVAAHIAQFAAGHGVAAHSLDGTWEMLARSGLAQPGLAFASWAEAMALGGLLTPIVANCPDVGTALAELERFHPLLDRDRIILIRRPESVSVSLRSPDGGPAHQDTVDACFAMLCRMMRRLAGQQAVPSLVALRRITPADRGPYEAALGRPVFDQPADSCRFDAEALRAPIAHADPAVRLALRPYAERRIARRRVPWSTAVSELAADGTFELAKVARALAISSRALQLRLEQEDTSFATLIDTVRRERALALLAEPDLPISAIATRIGFATPSAFTRAFRRWTGMPPSRYRQVS